MLAYWKTLQKTDIHGRIQTNETLIFIGLWTPLHSHSWLDYAEWWTQPKYESWSILTLGSQTTLERPRGVHHDKRFKTTSSRAERSARLIRLTVYGDWTIDLATRSYQGVSSAGQEADKKERFENLNAYCRQPPRHQQHDNRDQNGRFVDHPKKSSISTSDRLTSVAPRLVKSANSWCYCGPRLETGFELLTSE